MLVKFVFSLLYGWLKLKYFLDIGSVWLKFQRMVKSAFDQLKALVTNFNNQVRSGLKNIKK